MEFVLSLPEYDGQWFDINHQDIWGETPLHVAVGGLFECVKMLLDAGARRDLLTTSGQVPLHLSSLSEGDNRFKIVDILSSDEGQHVNAQDGDGRPPLFDILDTPECVALLLQRGAFPSICDNKGRTAIHHACMEGQVESLKLLLNECDADLAVSFDKDKDVPLAKAFEFKNAACIITLIERNAIGNMNERDGMTLAHRAAQMGNVEVLQCVFNHWTFKKGQKDAQGRRVDEVASNAGSFKHEVRNLIQLYESKGTRVDRKGKGRDLTAQSQGPSSYVLAQSQAESSTTAEARMAYFSHR